MVYSCEKMSGRRGTSEKMKQSRQRDQLSHGGEGCYWGIYQSSTCLPCFHPSFSLVGRPLLLHSCPFGAAMAGTLLLLSAEGRGLRRHGHTRGGGVFWDIVAVSPPPLP